MLVSAHEIGSAASSYQILAKLATGGMAEIFLARGSTAAGVARHVVLKRVLRERASDFELVRMFLDEARLAAQLQHPNIAQVYDVGKLGDSYFFTMEYVHGATVRELVDRARTQGTHVPTDCMLAIAAGTAAGLHHAHERIGIAGRPLGIVHRDVSPSNLIVSYEGNIKVVDFGVAKTTDRMHETRTGAIRGKIGYLSPEQAMGGDLDRRSDVFSLGIVMWELLTLQRLYKYDSDFKTMAAIVDEPSPAPSTIRPELPPAVDALVLRALAKRPEERFQTAKEMLEAIDGVTAAIGAVTSPAAVARFLRELFGVRPEPWIEIAELETRPEVVTVTAEPIPSDLVAAMASPIDRQLAAVIDLSLTLHYDLPSRASVAPTPGRRWTSRAVVSAAIAVGLLAGVVLMISRHDPATARAQASAPPRSSEPASSPADANTMAADVLPDAVVIEVEAAPSRPAPPPRPLVKARPPDPDDMAIYACRAGDAVKARKWLAKVAGAKRARVRTACSAAGIALEPSKSRPDCSEPGACQW